LIQQHPPEPWWIKIADFGLSKRVEDNRNGTSSVKYSMGFVAPEVLFPTKHEKENGIDQYAVDIWAVACINVFMLTKNPPFSDLSDLSNYGKSDEAALDQQQWRISDEGRELLMKMLIRDPAERPTAEIAMEHEWVALKDDA
jgi:serine/threonine protein kinase